MPQTRSAPQRHSFRTLSRRDRGNLAGTDPWTVFRSFLGLANPVFFDSVAKHPTLGRYSFLSADPFQRLWSRNGRTRLEHESNSPSLANPLGVLGDQLRRYQSKPIPGLPPFQGGAAGLLGYDLCHHIERLPWPLLDEFELPEMAIGVYDWVIAFDHLQNRAWLISTGFPETTHARRSRRAPTSCGTDQIAARVAGEVAGGQPRLGQRRRSRPAARRAA